MRSARFTALALPLLTAAAITTAAFAGHPPLDEHGGYFGSNGTYHVEIGQLKGLEFQSRDAAVRAALSLQGGAAPTLASPDIDLLSQKLDEVIALLRAGPVGAAQRGYAPSSTPARYSTSAPPPDDASVDPAAPSPASAATTTQANPAGGRPTGQSTASGAPIYEGPRGGHYHYSASGNKVYERKRK